MIYTEAVNYIHSLLKFGIRPGLSGMDALLRLLDNPHKKLKFIHVAGTNGKGSTSTAISNVMIDAGYKVGLYTSPYVCHFLERIQYNGLPVDEAVFSHAVAEVKDGVKKLENDGVIITEFEALTAAAFLCFNVMECDVVVLEVGLGGRLDATNVIETPLVNVITSLSIDHSAILGDTIEQIAFEKCGTIKEKSNVVCSFGQHQNALKVIKDSCQCKNAKLVLVDENNADVIDSDIYGTKFVYKYKEYFVKMPGLHQVKNMSCVIEACNILSDSFNISQQNICNGIKKTQLPARVEILNEKPLIILDGGHNSDGAKAFYDVVKNSFSDSKKVIVVAGMMVDKAVEESLMPLMKNSSVFVAVTPDNLRSMSSDALAEIASKYCKNVVRFNNAKQGIDYSFKNLDENSVLFVVGSLYLAGEVRQHIIDLINLKYKD